MKDSLRFQRKTTHAKHNLDRYLLNRAGVLSYSRKLPTSIRQHLADAPETIRLSLGTSSLHEARAARDKLEAKHNSLWLRLLKQIEDNALPALSTYAELAESVEVYDFSGWTEKDRDNLADILISRLERTNPAFVRALYEGKHANAYEFVGSDEGRALLNSAAKPILRDIQALVGPQSWLDLTSQRIEHDASIGDVRKNDLQATAAKLTKLNAPPPTTLTRREVKAIIRKLVEQGLAHSSTVAHLKRAKSLLVFHRRFNDLEDDQKLTAAIDAFDGHDLSQARKTAKQEPVRLQDMEQLLASPAPSREIELFVKCSVFLGTRAGELIKGHYNQREQLFEIGYHGEVVKTASSVRRVPVHTAIAADLAELKALELKYSRLAAHFRTWRDTAGLPEGLSLHNLRHGFATRLAAVGVSYEHGQILAGHSAKDVHSNYRHLRAEDLGTTVEKLDWHLVVSNWS